jgi:hypothetical protein
MPSVLAWIDHDLKARERAFRILSLFQEKESRDELGLGAVRDSFTDRLFPGTSTIQTRLRYMLFVPWMYRWMEEKRIPAESFASQADKLERGLIQPLMASNDQVGVFGKTAGNRIKRLPSSVYWAGLGSWGIRITPFSQEEYQRRINETYYRRDAVNSKKLRAHEMGDDSDDALNKDVFNWHPRLPAPPENFPAEADFSLSKEEAEFIKDCIQRKCPDSLLSFLASYCEPGDSEAPWNHPDFSRFQDGHKELLMHARLFSEVMHGAALSYNIQLAELRKKQELIDEHRGRFETWADQVPVGEIKSWDIKRLWELTVDYGHNITPQTRGFIQQWIEFVKNSHKTLLENSNAMNLIRWREMKLKGTRSRFKNQRALEQWGGQSGVEIGRAHV